MHIDGKTEWNEDKQLDTKTKKNLKKPTLSVVNAGPPDAEYLYYPLNVNGATQNGILLPAWVIWIIKINIKYSILT